MGRTHRSFFRICAIDKRSPRDGRVLEELGTYDPSITDTDARAQLRADRIDHWLSVGAQPSDKVAILIKKYGTNGTHAEAQKAALDKLAQPKLVPDPGKPASMPKAEEPEPTPEAAEAPAPDSAKTETAETESPAPEAEATPTEETAQTEETEKPAAEAATE